MGKKRRNEDKVAAIAKRAARRKPPLVFVSPRSPSKRGALPRARQTRQKASVKQTKAQFHSWFFPTVDTPMKMKMRVSLTLLSIFMKYLMVV